MTLYKCIRNCYTDVLCHVYSPFTTSRNVIVGTNFGDIFLISDDSQDSSCDDDGDDEFDGVCNCNCICQLVDEPPILNLQWDTSDTVYGLSSKGLHHIQLKPSSHQLIYNHMESNHLMDFTLIPNTTNLCMVSDDGKTKVIDKTTHQTIQLLQHHNGGIQACYATDNYVSTGGIDGYVHLYDSQFRTSKPICSFGDSKTFSLVNNICMNSTSTWLAVSGSESSEFPIVYNTRCQKELPMTDKGNETERIFAMCFDSKDGLYWGGPNGCLYKSDDLFSISIEMKTIYGCSNVPHILSIATKEASIPRTEVSVAGATNSILFSTNGMFWDSVLHLQS